MFLPNFAAYTMETEPQAEKPANPEAPARRSWARRILRFFMWTGGVVLLLIGVVLLLGYIYRDKVKMYVVNEANKYLNTVVIVAPEDIDLTLLKSFPDASVEFRNVKALDAIDIPKRDTLFKAERISLAFNIFDLFSGNYNIHRITASDASLNVWIDKNGKDNYHFLKTSSDTAAADTGHVSFVLESIELNNIAVHYRDRQTKSEVTVDVKEAVCSGNFTDEKFTLHTESAFYVHQVKSGGTTYFSENGGTLNLDAAVDQAAGSYTFESCMLRLADFALDVNGNIVEKNNDYLLDLAVKGNDIDLPATLSLLPQTYHERLKNFDYSGRFIAEATVKGFAGDSAGPVVEATFAAEKGMEMAKKDGSLTIRDIDLKGSFSNAPGKSKLEIPAFRFTSGKSRVNGQFSLKNFDKPRIAATLDARLAMGDLKALMQSDTIAKADGFLAINARTEGDLPASKTFSADMLKDFKTSGELTFENVSLHLDKSPLKADQLNGLMTFNNNDLALNKFKGYLAGSDFELDGTLRNLLPWLFSEKEDLTVDASLKSQEINLNTLLADESKTETSTTTDSAYHLAFPENLRLSLKTQINKLVFRKFTAATVRGDVMLRNRKLVIDPVLFSSMDGAVKGSAMIDAQRSDTILITCDANIMKVNITKLFTDFENFGQDGIQDKHLKGLVTADVKFASLWSSALEADMDKIYARADVAIEKGELIGFEPLKALSEYIKVEELEHIKFNTLKNQVEIKNRKVYLPFMDIESSAMNIGMSGTHGFDDVVDYRFRIRLEEYLARKAKTARKENEEFGKEEVDGGHRFSIYLSMKGPLSNPVIQYDRKGAAEKIKEDIQKEKQNLKEILHNEFNWFKKDTTLKSNPPDKNKKGDPAKTKNQNNDKFIIRWDEQGKDPDEDDDDF